MINFLLHPFAIAESLAEARKASSGEDAQPAGCCKLLGQHVAGHTKFITTQPLEVFASKVKLAGFTPWW